MKTTKVWHIGFFAGVILLNLLLFLRAPAFKTGGSFRAIWTGIVVATGAFMLLCLFRIRRQRTTQATQTPPPEPTSPQSPPSRQTKRSATPRHAKRRKKR